MTTNAPKIPPVPQFQRAWFDGRIAGDQELTKTDLRVGLILSKHSDSDGLAFPGNPLIARELGIDERRVRRSLESLERLGHIARVPRKADQHRWFRLIGGGSLDTQVHADARGYPDTRGGGYLDTREGGSPDIREGGSPDTRQNYAVKYPLNHPNEEDRLVVISAGQETPTRGGTEPEPNPRAGSEPKAAKVGAGLGADTNPEAGGPARPEADAEADADADLPPDLRRDGYVLLTDVDGRRTGHRVGSAKFGADPWEAGVFVESLLAALRYQRGNRSSQSSNGAASSSRSPGSTCPGRRRSAARSASLSWTASGPRSRGVTATWTSRSRG